MKSIFRANFHPDWCKIWEALYFLRLKDSKMNFLVDVREIFILNNWSPDLVPDFPWFTIIAFVLFLKIVEFEFEFSAIFECSCWQQLLW